MPMCVRVSLQYLEMVLQLHNLEIIFDWTAQSSSEMRLTKNYVYREGTKVTWLDLIGWMDDNTRKHLMSIFQSFRLEFFLAVFFFIRVNITITKPIGTMCQVYCKWKYICHENDLLRDLCTRVLCNRDLCNRDSGCAAILGPMHSLAGALSHRPWNLVQLCTRFVQLCTKSPFCHHRQHCRI